MSEFPEPHAKMRKFSKGEERGEGVALVSRRAPRSRPQRILRLDSIGETCGPPPNTPTDFMAQFFVSLERKGVLSKAELEEHCRDGVPLRNDWQEGEELGVKADAKRSDVDSVTQIRRAHTFFGNSEPNENLFRETGAPIVHARKQTEDKLNPELMGSSKAERMGNSERATKVNRLEQMECEEDGDETLRVTESRGIGVGKSEMNRRTFTPGGIGGESGSSWKRDSCDMEEVFEDDVFGEGWMEELQGHLYGDDVSKSAQEGMATSGTAKPTDVRDVVVATNATRSFGGVAEYNEMILRQNIFGVQKRRRARRLIGVPAVSVVNGGDQEEVEMDCGLCPVGEGAPGAWSELGGEESMQEMEKRVGRWVSSVTPGGNGELLPGCHGQVSGGRGVWEKGL